MFDTNNNQAIESEGQEGTRRDTNDGQALSEIIKKSLDVNKYATKKTIAQGLLDVALLTANASQLKYVLQVGEKHEFYTLMLTLIIVSIVLQVTAAFLALTVSVLASQEDDNLTVVTWILHHISLALVTGALFCDVIKMNFGLDPAVPYSANATLRAAARVGLVLQAILCVLLGSRLDINKENHQDNANKANNIILCLNIVVMAINILISAFEMKESTDHIDGTVTTTPSSLVAKCIENDS